MIGTPKPSTAIRSHLQRNIPFLGEEIESQMLSELGLPRDIRDMKLGQVQYLNSIAASKVNLPLPQNTVEIVSERGYDWRNEPSLKSLSPYDALYLDSIVRLNEIHESFIENPTKKEDNALLEEFQ